MFFSNHGNRSGGLRSLPATPIGPPPDINGEWSYECIRDDETYKHEGTATIKVIKGPLGHEFSISGKRIWKAHKVGGNWVVEQLAAPASWDSQWGTFTNKDALRYGYSINVNGGLVQGYGWAAIKGDGKGKIDKLEGNFWQLPEIKAKSTLGRAPGPSPRRLD